MQPDVIINPHAFPSRMTIGMFVESLAGKAGALHGQAQDATPFRCGDCQSEGCLTAHCALSLRFGEANSPAEHFGQQLLAAGYSFHGNEPMYSGVTGEEFPADIYLGVVYYQRLRHMVGDKWQVRTTGKVDQQTRQPVKASDLSRIDATRLTCFRTQGRKRGGGIRFGEMERDALLAHGTAFLLQDRLMNCSDYSTAYVCRRCGSLVSLGFDGDAAISESLVGEKRTRSSEEYCRVCQLSAGGEVDVVAVPYVSRSGQPMVCRTC